jgi:hypothetical protein
MRYLLGLLAATAPLTIHADSWFGLPPDCWAKPRNYHELNRDDPWKKNVTITRINAKKPRPGVYSPNRGYFFVIEGKGRPDAKITVYAEKNHVIEIRFTALHGMTETRWINEKLLYMRPWWGKIAATDIIYDVEKEMVIHTESVMDGSLAFQQYRENCPKQGCECIKKKQ